MRLAGISLSPLAFRFEFIEVFMKFVTVIPGISTGYWKDKKIPLCDLSSGGISTIFSPLNKISPSKTSKFSFPAIAADSVLLPDPLGPIIA